MTQTNSWHIKVWVLSFVFIAHRPLRDKITLAIEAEIIKNYNNYFSPYLLVIKYNKSFTQENFKMTILRNVRELKLSENIRGIKSTVLRMEART